MNCGMVAACTGVIWEKPIVDTASRIHPARGGLRAPQDLGSLFEGTFPGAIATVLCYDEVIDNGGAAAALSQKMKQPPQRNKFVSYLHVREVHWACKLTD